MELTEETVTDLTKRLRRAEGQVRGVQQMLSEGRDCRDIITQLSAVTKALDQVLAFFHGHGGSLSAFINSTILRLVLRTLVAAHTPV